MKKSTAFILIALLISLAVCLCGCMKIGMTKKSITSRLEENGYKVTMSQTIIDVQDPSMKGINLLSTMYGGKNVDGVVKFVYVYFCADSASADRLEYLLKEFSAVNPYETHGNLTVYRYEETLLIGDFESVSIGRNY